MNFKAYTKIKTKHQKKNNGGYTMKKFEIGKRYLAESGSPLTFEIISRTAKRIKFVEIQHAGRYNEKKGEEKTATIKNWDDTEVFFTSCGATIKA